MDDRPRYAGPVTPDERPDEHLADRSAEHSERHVDDGSATAAAAARLGATLGKAAPTAGVGVPTRVLVAVGTACWSVALVVTLVVPALHEGDRSWWPWSCVTGIVLGAFAWWYVSRAGFRDV